ncbi:DUF4276 family protein [uncultured Bacteroides sp.]|uniref:DUF4276 family protein n=2 Tax=Bacteroides TaxID=816 RepID=UPI00033650BC|nr:DUF4276 family protein [uncultured Bacteroides sp.]CDA85729.1 uncharacterized protein BN772_03748 [Bacteroides sp. CAG:754]
MAVQVFIGLTTEGSTDHRFLMSIVERTFIDVAFECTKDVEPYVKFLDVNKSGLGFIQYIEKASKQGVEEMGMTVLCVHTDADDATAEKAYNNKINPAKQFLKTSTEQDICQLLTPIIPIQMIEAWMLADKELLKREIGTNKSDNDLGINRPPEQFSDPKDIIINAIRIAREDIVKRKRCCLDISDLYLPIGQKIELRKLENLNSYKTFKEEVRNTYKKLHLIK